MLAVTPLRTSHGGCGDERDHMDIARSSADVRRYLDDEHSVLDDINFDDLFPGLEDGDIIPDLEFDPDELFGDCTVADQEGSGGSPEDSVGIIKANSRVVVPVDEVVEEKVSCVSDSQEEEVVSVMSTTKEEESAAAIVVTPSSSSSPAVKEGDKRRKSSPGPSKAANGKRKAKVDWTPELHRRFVQAVEQLGVEKAVPSRILELMGIDCLTRHNIASHLQKYRSHRKHLLAREAEAASWSQRRHMYTAAGAGGPKSEVSPWLALTMGFPHPPPPPMQHLRPLHVWGHPPVEPPPPPMAAPPHPWLRPAMVAPAKRLHGIPPWAPPPLDPAYWHQPYYTRGQRDGWAPSALTQGTPCYPQAMRFPAPPVPTILPRPMYRPSPTIPTTNKQSPGAQISLDSHHTNESIDAAIGEVRAKPWLPLPLGLKPPSLDSVMGELQRQGISNIPPTCS